MFEVTMIRCLDAYVTADDYMVDEDGDLVFTNDEGEECGRFLSGEWAGVHAIAMCEDCEVCEDE